MVDASIADLSMYLAEASDVYVRVDTRTLLASSCDDRGQIDSKGQSLVVEQERTARTALKGVMDPDALAELDEQLGWSWARDKPAARPRRDDPQTLRVSGEWIQSVGRWANVAWNDDHEAVLEEYEADVQLIAEQCDTIAGPRCREQLLRADRQLMERVLRGSLSGTPEVLADLLGVRERFMVLHQGNCHRSVEVDLAELMVRQRIAWHESPELRERLGAYSEQRLQLLPQYMATEYTLFYMHSDQMRAVALCNAQFLDDLESLLPEEQHESLWSAYWTTVHPLIMNDGLQAHARYRDALADDSPIGGDLRFELEQRLSTYQDRYRQLTVKMLAVVRGSFIWTRSSSDRAITGHAPNIGRDDPVKRRDLLNWYRERKNLNAMEHVYLDIVLDDD